jgi:hypothetical protein
MHEDTPRDVLIALLAHANGQLVDANRRARALSGKIDRCEAHMRTALGYPDGAPDAGLESLVVQAKHHFPLFRRTLEMQHVLNVLADHRPNQLYWSCTCGEMESADWRTHHKAHRAHLAEVLTSTTLPESTGHLDSETMPEFRDEHAFETVSGACCPGGPFHGHRAWCGTLQEQIRPLLDRADRTRERDGQ